MRVSDTMSCDVFDLSLLSGPECEQNGELDGWKWEVDDVKTTWFMMRSECFVHLVDMFALRAHLICLQRFRFSPPNVVFTLIFGYPLMIADCAVFVRDDVHCER
ncbi:hypothetical protein Tco_0939943 [Tanacetum coccineum]|uniref:Uncharacterized protein n=1 Tax=Tanacetum coccineum TaxID=301880 RepID=A0ABQ5DP37_9ASTR